MNWFGGLGNPDNKSLPEELDFKDISFGTYFSLIFLEVSLLF